MTLDLMMKEVWRQLGDPPDLDPSTDTQYNGGPLLRWALNEGQREVALWKDPAAGKVIRHPQLYGEMFFQTVVRTFTLTSQVGATTSTIILPAGASALDDAYNGWIVASGSQYFIVVDYVGATKVATINGVWGVQPIDTGTVTLYKRFMMFGVGSEPWIADHILLPSSATNMRTQGNLLEILKIGDIDQQVEITRAAREEDYIGMYLSVGDPQTYFRKGNQIIFDQAPATAKWYRMEYMRLPTEMPGNDPTTEVPELPEQFHYPICLWAVEWGQRQAQDYALAYATERKIDGIMRKVASLDDFKDDRRSDRGRFRRK